MILTHFINGYLLDYLNSDIIFSQFYLHMKFRVLNFYCNVHLSISIWNLRTTNAVLLLLLLLLLLWVNEVVCSLFTVLTANDNKA